MRYLYSFFFFSAFLHSSFLFGQFLSVEEEKFLALQQHVVCDDQTLSNADWKSLSDKVQSKRIVMLGEPNHGSRELFLLHNDLIKHLHQNLGFNVILFESGIGELAELTLGGNDLSPNQMAYGLTGPWRTCEFVELMTYVKTENLDIAGFDVQRSGDSFKHVLRKMTDINSAFSSLALHLEERFTSAYRELTSKKVVYDSIKNHVTDLLADYDSLHSQFLMNTKLESLSDELLIARTLHNRVNYLSYMLQFVKDKDWNKRWAARDKTMAENVQWLLDTVYRTKKVIVLAHNFHISRFSEKELSMGELLSEIYKEQFYTIGFFAGAGSYADNSGKESVIKPADSSALDIKHVVNQLTGYASFIDISQQATPAIKWCYQSIITNDTFVDLSQSNTMVLAQHFDGLVLVKTVSPPLKIE